MGTEFSLLSPPHTLSAAIKCLYRERCVANVLADQARAVAGLSAPINPEAIAASLGIVLIFEDIRAQAQYRVENGRPVIVIKRETDLPSSLAVAQQRFAIAHEIGHHMLREEVRDVWPEFTFCSDDPFEESLCDRFAAELLMPSALVSRDLRQTHFLPHRLLEVTSRYGVTLEAVLLRAIELFGAIVNPILWDRDGAQWRVRWAARPQDWHALFCDTGHTPIERSYATLYPHAGSADLLFNGKRQRFATIALRLRGTSTVVSLLTTCAQTAKNWEPYRVRREDKSEREGHVNYRASPQRNFAFARPAGSLQNDLRPRLCRVKHDKG
jgi:Zn-dependent peptidase ImmA (M78 family)